ncbi:MAG TPA: glycosyltransferase [Phototrophicaceae bacterium]|nr:glycosyltransferase [Phototrophicaceae bacterium]
MTNNPNSFPRKTDILMLVDTHVYDDSRVMPEGSSLAQAGYTVRVIGLARFGGLPVQNQINGMEILLAPMETVRTSIQFFCALWRWICGDTNTVNHPTPTYKTSNIFSIIFFSLWMLRLGLNRPAKVIHCHDLLQLPTGWLLSRWHRAKLVYDSHESAEHTHAQVSKRFGQFAAFLERVFAPKTDAVIAVGERVGEDIRKQGANRVVVIGNWKKLEHFAPDHVRLKAERERLALNKSKLVISYLGSLYYLRNLEQLLEAVIQSPDVHLIISGQGPLEYLVHNALPHASNIHWLGWLKKADVDFYTQLSDVVYCCIHPTYYQADYVVPNKLFEAFAAGKALIAYKGVGEMSQILESFPAALLLDPVTPETLKLAFQQLQHSETLHQLQRAAIMARKTYNWAVAEKRLLDLYSELTL